MAEDRLRIDKWLWFARFAKTRTLAQKLVISGRIRVNRQKIENAARVVKIGDVLTIALDSGVRILKISAMTARRGPASEARLLYDDLSPPASGGLSSERHTSKGRPTKRERRIIDKIRHSAANLYEDFPSRSDRPPK